MQQTFDTKTSKKRLAPGLTQTEYRPPRFENSLIFVLEQFELFHVSL